MKSQNLNLVKPTSFHCTHCGQTSHGPFMIGPHEVAPACRNDYCPDQWWNRMARTLPVTGHLIRPAPRPEDEDLFRLQALAKKETRHG